MLYVDRSGTSSPVNTVAAPRRRVTGRYLAHNRLNAKARARLARDIVRGRAEVTDLTIRQVSRLCRVSVPTINDVDRKPASLVDAFIGSTPEQRRELALTAGVGTIWNELIEPFV